MSLNCLFCIKQKVVFCDVTTFATLGTDHEQLTLDMSYHIQTPTVVFRRHCSGLRACFSDDQEVVVHSDDAFAPVAFLHFRSMHLEKNDMVGSLLSPSLPPFLHLHYLGSSNLDI